MTPETRSPLDRILIGRQPILDRAQELVGYELLFRSADLPAETPDCPLGATAGVVCAAFSELGLGDALGRCRAFINADARFVMDDVLELLPAAGVVLELDFAEAPDAALLERCRQLRERGYSLALARYRGRDARSEALLPLVDIVKVDVPAVGARLAAVVGELQHLPVRILAEKIETRELMESCRDLGCHLFQGFFFARPKVVSGRHLSASQLSIIRLLNLVARDADSEDLEEHFKREPGLTVNLLRLVNAVGFGLTHKVDSLRHAIAILGRKQLLRWLQLLLMAAPGRERTPERNPLLQIAAQRGRLMELLAGRRDPALVDEAFLAGIMSLMPAALGLPMDEILEQIPVADGVRQALTAHAGEPGRLLALAECIDAHDWAGCDAALAELPTLSRETVSASLTEAMAWIHAGDDGA